MAAAMARPWPVFPEVGSTMVPPGLSRPARSAASIMGRPMRSLTLPPGFSISNLARTVGRTPWVTRRRRTSGVWPMASRNVSSTGTVVSWPRGALILPENGGRGETPARRLPLRLDQLVDVTRVAEVDPAFRRSLHRQDAVRVAIHHRLRDHAQPIGRQRDAADLARVVGAEEQAAAAVPPQAAALAEHDSGRRDHRGAVPELGSDPWPRPAVVGVPR